MCLYPRFFKNPKYKPNKKNGGKVPPVFDERVLYVPVGCSNCVECRKRKAREWQVRLLEDIKQNRNGKFITLTFTDEAYRDLAKEHKGVYGYTLDNAIATRAVRLFLERWRKKYKKSLRHWLVTEIGHNGTENIHLHGIIWTDEPLEEVEAKWSYGFVWKGKKTNVSGKMKLVNYVNNRTITYISKYVTKMDEKHRMYKPVILCSKGIGANYTNGKLGDWNKNVYKGKNTDETYRTSTGHKIAMPNYWRNKIYTDEEREHLWIHKLDLEERWVMGEKVNVSKTDKGYKKLVEYYRRQNVEFGYGDSSVDIERRIYEHEQRKLRQLTRLKKAYNKKKKV